MHAQKSKKAPSFEMALKKLEEIVGALENGEITLSELVDSYKEGVYYKNICQEHIERAELLLDEIDAAKTLMRSRMKALELRMWKRKFLFFTGKTILTT